MNVPSTFPSLARSLVTLLLPLLAAQMLAPLSCFLIKCSGGISRGNLSLIRAGIFP